jgi:hypothetical protein
MTPFKAGRRCHMAAERGSPALLFTEGGSSGGPCLVNARFKVADLALSGFAVHF